MRAYKTVNDSYIEPISFVVPRRAEVFQADIYPPATGIKPGVSAADWLSGKSALPPKISLESIYEGGAPVEVPADYKPPVTASAPLPAKPASPTKKESSPAPAPVAAKAPPPTMADQKGSISAMASKFQDNDPEDEADDDDASSFEEVSRPAARAAPAAVIAKPTPKPDPKPASPVTARAPAAASQPTPRSTVVPTPTATVPASSGPKSPISSSPQSSSVEASLKQITTLLEQQTKTLTAQSEKIGNLTKEVDMLKMRVGSGSTDQSERIRQLELELEAARS